MGGTLSRRLPATLASLASSLKEAGSPPRRPLAAAAPQPAEEQSQKKLKLSGPITSLQSYFQITQSLANFK